VPTYVFFKFTTNIKITYVEPCNTFLKNSNLKSINSSKRVKIILCAVNTKNKHLVKM